MQQSRWKVSTRMNTDMVLDALEQALHDRGMPKNVIHHSDRGVNRTGFVGDFLFKLGHLT